MNKKQVLYFLMGALIVISACGIPGAVNPPVSPNIATPVLNQSTSGGQTAQPPVAQPAVASQPNASNAPTLKPPNTPSGASTSDKTEPSLTNVNISSTKAYYHDNGCGPTKVTVSADATDNSGNVSQVWADYRYISMSAGVGGNQWFRVSLKSKGNNHYEGVIDLTKEADGELLKNDGTLEYQVSAMDAAGNIRVVPDGFIYGVEALPCFPMAPPPGGASFGQLTISNVVAYPKDAVYYGNCTTENTNLNIQATIEPLSEIASATIYYAYTSNGSIGNYSTAMFQLGIGDYAGDIDVGGEAGSAMNMLGTDTGTLEAYIHVEGINGNTVDSNWISIPVLLCGGVIGNPVQPQPTVTKGNGNIKNNYSLDLGDADGDDVIFSHTTSDGTQLLSVWGSELSIDLSSDIASCKASIDNGQTFSVVNINPQDVICYKTGSGNYGYLVVDGLFIDLDSHNNSYVKVSYETEVMP